MFDRFWNVLRWFSPVVWVTTGVAAMATVVIHFINTTPAQTLPAAWVVMVGFIGYAIWALRMARKDFHEAKEWQPMPALNETRIVPTEWAPTRYPLSAPLREELLRQFAVLESAGVVEPGEVSADEIVDAAEFQDDYSSIDLYAVANVLQSLHEERGVPLKRVMVFQSQVEIEDDDVLDIVNEFARLSGRTDSLHGLRLTIEPDFAQPSTEDVLAGTAQPNAVVHFTLGAQDHSLPIVMFYKYLPLGLFEELAPIFESPEEPRRFFSAYFLDMTTIVTFAEPTKVAALNNATGTEDWPEPWRPEF